MVKKLIVLTLVIFLTQFFSACSKEQDQEQAAPEKPKGSLLADVDGEGISLDDYSQHIMRLPSKMRRAIVDKESKEKVLNDMISEKLLYKEALKRNYETNEQVVEKMAAMKRAIILEAFVKDLLKQDIVISDEEIVDYFNEHKEEFGRPAMVKVMHILTLNKESAEKVMAELKKGGDFADLAKKNSTDSMTARKGGDLGFLPRGKMPPEFDEAAFALKKENDISGIVKTKLGYHIIKLTGRLPEIESTLSPTIISKIKRIKTQKMQEEIITDFVEEIKANYNVSTHEEMLDSFVIPSRSGHGSSMGGGAAGFH
jgi:peptidyl-prolyl cis-trans isomerase C